ncbi:hypothetical protein [Psychrobacter phenylpyruvicus]|uniref:Uncharacterized protein n=1 Tax=Psychrobacter phenylpyruvicus TaxID=29432 RepID=A0A379LM40_9GAMM|nr:hypothetical protein [Psychrobacter phenylpyruvicus]SUD91666.1 Uncharacterised protein [Psychrobacter phenylpyruvicus]
MSLTALLSNKKVAVRTTTLVSVMLGAALTLTACGDKDHEVKAVDRVDEAAELARANAPEPEPLAAEDIVEVEPAADAATAEEGATDAPATEDAAAETTADAEASEATATEKAAEEPATEEAAQ